MDDRRRPLRRVTQATIVKHGKGRHWWLLLSCGHLVRRRAGYYQGNFSGRSRRPGHWKACGSPPTPPPQRVRCEVCMVIG